MFEFRNHETVTVAVNGESFDLANFTYGKEHYFESFRAYALRILLPFMLNHVPEMKQVRCSVSGFVASTLSSEELVDLVTHGVAALKLDRFNDILNRPSREELVDGIESLIDHVSIRVLLSARPSPSLNYKNDTMAISHLSSQRQLAILLNLLLWDGGMYRGNAAGVEDMVTRLRKSANVADNILAHWFDVPALETLRMALIELDAKFYITKLEFTRREKETLDSIRNNDSLDVERLIAFVSSMTVYREKHSDIVAYPNRWTQKAYRDNAFRAAERFENSNILKLVPAGKSLGPAKHPIGGNATGVKRGPGRPKGPEKAPTAKQVVNENLVNKFFGSAFSDAIKNMKK